MASARVTYSQSSLIGSKIANVARLGAQFRQALLEVHLDIEAYNDDNTQLAADAGLADAAAASNIRGQYNLAAAEMTGTVINTVAAGQQTSVKVLIDQTA